MRRRGSIADVPLQSEMHDDSGRLTRAWIDFFHSLAGPKFWADSHALRLTETLAAGLLPVGSRFDEADRGVSYKVDFYRTTITAGITDVATTLTLALVGDVVAGTVLAIDAEQIRVASMAGAVATVERGINGTTAAAHAAGAIVTADFRAWVVTGGEMRAVLASLPGDLTAADAGFRFIATNYDRRFRWSGTAWTRDDGELPTGATAMFPAVPSSGWALCDGSTVTRTKADGTTESYTTPNMVGKFVKGGTYTGSGVAAVVPTISGNTADEAAHTHAIDHDHASVTSGTASAGVTVQSGSGASAASASHTHDVDVPAFTGDSGAGSAHHHGAGSLVLSGAGEPAHVLYYFCTRL